MSSNRQTSKDDTCFRVLHILKDNPDITQRELAERLGVSVGALNYCLRSLVDKGFVKVQNFSASPNKCGYAYVLTPQGISEKITLTKAFLQRKLREYDALKAEIAAMSDGCDADELLTMQQRFER